jgi:hypothetical protein
MKLIALKKISAKIPKGSEFELPDRQALPLVVMKAARAVDEKPSRPRQSGGGTRGGNRVGGSYSTRHVASAENTSVLTPPGSSS